MASNFSGLGTATAAYWFQFFLDAGIPPSDAGNYAVTFTENRIQQDMIVDLTKEYLHEMGVTVLGDTIAILKHAKRVHTQATREKVLNGSGLSSTTMAAGSSRSLLSASGMAGKLSAPAKVSAPVRPSRPATEQISEQLNKTPTSSQTTVKPLGSQARPDALSKKVESQTMLATAPVKDVQMPTKKKSQKLQDALEIGPTTTTTVKGSVVRLKPKIVHEVPVPKVRNVTQEQEGGYKIIFPSGVIKKTKVTATQPKKTPTASKADTKSSSSVFDRLGQELTVDKAPTKASARLMVAGTAQVEKVNKDKATTGSTVFCRLGEKRELKRPGAANDVDNADIKKKAKISVEDRLGPAKASIAPSKSAGILSYSTMPDARPVHLRLGNKSVLPPGVGEGDSIATGTCSLNSGRTKMRTASAEPKTAASWNDSVERTATRCQKISFNSDAFISNTGLTKRIRPQQNLKDDLVIHVESQNSGGATVRRIGSQKLTGGAPTQPTLNKSGNVMKRLGNKMSEGQAVQPNADTSSNVMLRLGSRRASEDQAVQVKPQKPVQVTVRFGSLKMMTAAQDSSWAVPPAASKSGVFSRLGNRTSSAAV